MRVDVDLTEAKEFEQTLKEIGSKALPHAARDGLNRLAFQSRVTWIGNVRQAMTLRNTYTERSIRVVKATGTKVATMQSVLGSTADYMDERETGDTQTAKGKHGVPIPTPSASGQSGGKRTKPIQRKNYLSAIALRKRVTGSRQRKNAAALRMAKRDNGFAALDTGKRFGIFRVEAGRRSKRQQGPMQRHGKSGEAFSFRIRMVYDLSRKSVTTKPIPTLGDTVKEANRIGPVMMQKALETQIARVRGPR